MQIKSLLKSTGIALEKQGVDTFGAAVDDFARAALGGQPADLPLFGAGGDPTLLGDDSAPVNTRTPRDPRTWYSTSYAAALAGGTNYRPKLKFLFKVQFLFKDGLLQQLVDAGLLGSSDRDRLEKNEFTFMIKSVDRPKVDFEYDDDVNQYNFRTKVLKKIRHRELTITFMDDVGNRVFDFFRVLMMIYSPITRRQMTRENQTRKPDSATIAMANGMNFSDPGENTYAFNSHRAVINSDVGTALDIIRVKQMFMDPMANNVSDAPREVIFDFMNPRLVSFDLDDLSHESSEVNLLTMQFDYDWMEMVRIEHMEAADTPVYDISVKGITNAPSDILTGKNPPDESRTQSNAIGAAGGTNPFAAIITRQVGRAAQQLTATAVNRAVKAIAGNGPLGTALGGAIGTPLAGVANGIIGAASTDLLNGVASSAKSTYANITRPAAADSATFGPDTTTAYVKSTDGTAY